MTNEVTDGILIVNKPEGWTSHDVVNKTKYMIRAKKVGHAGTLDPMATGVLVLLINKATKTASRYESDGKRYKAEVTFGTSTDSYDRTGTVTDTGLPENIAMEDLEREISGFLGEQEQLPPMYSAVKVKGKKLYELARKGKTVERKARKITIERIDADISSFPVITLDICCSKGTYVRSIAHDLGVRLGCPSHLSGLVRTESGDFTLDEAVDFILAVENNDKDMLLENIRPLSL